MESGKNVSSRKPRQPRQNKSQASQSPTVMMNKDIPNMQVSVDGSILSGTELKQVPITVNAQSGPAVISKEVNEAQVHVPDQPKPLSAIAKVQMMNGLATAATSEEIKALLLAQPHGQAIYDLFVASIEAKITELMTGVASKEQAENLKTADSVLSEFVGTMRSVAMMFNTLMQRQGGGLPQVQQQHHQQRPRNDHNDASVLDNY